ncbi:MAG: hypothetical protein NTY01_09630 [Verrucomicrobia bacterium]|nr:hypothetical protein [Verrucomicrobiota bacterium]
MIALLLAATGFGQGDIMARPPKKHGSANELVRLTHDTRVGEPYHARNMTVYPLFTSGCAAQACRTLDEALARRLIRISEKGEGNVPELLVENLSDDPVFLLAGEIVTGGRQNRVIAQDILLAPRGGPISLGVFCVEHGRWTTQTKYFDAEKELAHNQLRQQLSAPANSQSAIWSEVARKSSAIAPAEAAPTGYLGAALKDPSVQSHVEAYTKPLALPSDANGMVVVIRGQVVGVEIFGDSGTFRKLREKLLRSYAMDALENAVSESPAVGREMVEEFLRRVERARLASKQSVGIGRFFSIGSGGLYGSVLLWHEQQGAHGVVHTSFFPEIPVSEASPIRPMPHLQPSR